MRRRDGHVTQEGLFWLDIFEGIPTFPKEIDHEERWNCARKLFTPRKIFSLDHFAQQYSKDSRDTDLSSISLWWDDENNNRFHHNPIGFDAIQLIEQVRGHAAPVAAVSLRLDKGVILTDHVQGVYRRSAIWNKLFVDVMLYDLFTRFAWQFGFRSAHVLKGEKNLYYERPQLLRSQTMQQYRDRLVYRYTTLPAKLGFQQNERPDTLAYDCSAPLPSQYMYKQIDVEW